MQLQRKIVLLTGLLFLSLFSFSQNVLTVTSTKKNKKRVFKAGQTFLFMTYQNPQYVKGKILEIKDSSLILYLPEELVPEEKELSPDSIYLIRKPSRLHYIAYGIGSVFILNGAFFLLEGPSVSKSSFVNRGIGGVSFALGLIPFLLQPATYEIGKDASLSIESLYPEPEVEENLPGEQYP